MKYYERDATTVCVDLFGYITTWWNGAEDFSNTIQAVQAKYKNLVFRVNCYGGSCYEGNAAFNTLKFSSLNISWEIIGLAASMGSIIPLSKGKVYIADNAQVMIHCPKSMSFSGTAKAFFSEGKSLKDLEDAFCRTYAKKINKKPADVAYLMDGIDHWFNADECIKMGYADGPMEGVVDVEQVSKPDPGTPMEEVYNRYAAAMQLPIEQREIQNRNMDKNLIIASFGLTGVDDKSSDTAVLQALQASVTEKNTQIKTLGDKVKDLQKAGITAAIAAKETELGLQFTAEQKASFEYIGTTDMNMFNTVLGAFKPAPIIKDMVTDEAKTNGHAETGKEKEDKARAEWTYKDWEKNDSKGLESLSKSDKAEDKAKFAALYEKEFGDKPF